MAILKQSTTFPTCFVLARDIAAIVTSIKEATSTLTVFFLGEAHNNDFDVARRRGVFEALRNDAGIILAVERTLVAQNAASNLVLEMNDLKSADDGRNGQIVGLLQEKLDENPNTRAVVFFYGQEHEYPICQHLLKKLDGPVGLYWVSSLPIDMSLKNALDYFPSLFSTVGRKPVGYCENSGSNYLLKLLEKGYVPESFSVDLYSAEQKGVLFTKTIYAIYFKDKIYTDHQRKIVNREGSSGVAIKRISGAYTVVAKIIKSEQVAAAEAGTLDV